MELSESMRLKDIPVFQLLEKFVFAVVACVSVGKSCEPVCW